MPLIELVGSLFVGLCVGLLLKFPRLNSVSKELSLERERGKAKDEALHRLELDLASLRPEANRAAQAELDRLQLSDAKGELERECAALTASLESTKRAIADERTQTQLLKAEQQAEIEALRQQIEIKRQENTSLGNRISSLETSIEERERSLQQERQQFHELKNELSAQFAELSSKALRENNETFLDTAKSVLALQHKDADADLAKRQDEILRLVKPIQDGIKAVSEVANEMEAKRQKAFGSIEQQLEQAVLQSAEVARQASALKDALRKPNVRGRWGEVQLENCIELAGMDQHCDLTFQNTSVGSDDERIRPDMEVYMPGGRKIVVDSKTPLEHFLNYIEATSEEARNASLLRHAKGVRGHVDNLAKTDYMQRAAGSPDFVVMFLPNESFLAMALEREPNLMQYAIERKVLIATPGTLIGLLKVIRYGWDERKQSENAARITEEGRKLNSELTAFLLDFAKLGLALKNVSEAYDNSAKRVERQITRSSQKLTDLGAKATLRKNLTKTDIGLLKSALSTDFEDENPGPDGPTFTDFEYTPASLPFVADGEGS